MSWSSSRRTPRSGRWSRRRGGLIEPPPRRRRRWSWYGAGALLVALILAGIASMVLPIRSARMLVRAEAATVRMTFPGDDAVTIELGLSVTHLLVEGELRMIDDPSVSSDWPVRRFEFERSDSNASQPRIVSLILPPDAVFVVDASRYPSIELTAMVRGDANVRVRSPGRHVRALGAGASEEERDLNLFNSTPNIEHRGGIRPLRVVFSVTDMPDQDSGFELHGLAGVPAYDLGFIHVQPGAAGVSTRFRSSLIEGSCTFRGRDVGRIHLRYGEEVRGGFEGVMLRTTLDRDRVHILWQGDVTSLRAGFGDSVRGVMPTIFEYVVGTSPQAYIAFLLSYLAIAVIFRVIGLRPPSPRPGGGGNDAESE